jgi:hypothetical protein
MSRKKKPIGILKSFEAKRKGEWRKDSLTEVFSDDRPGFNNFIYGDFISDGKLQHFWRYEFLGEELEIKKGVQREIANKTVDEFVINTIRKKKLEQI